MTLFGLGVPAAIMTQVLLVTVSSELKKIDLLDIS
jgi:hypothetical protein